MYIYTYMYTYKPFPQQAAIQRVQNIITDGPSQAIQAITWLGWRSEALSVVCEQSQARHVGMPGIVEQIWELESNHSYQLLAREV